MDNPPEGKLPEYAYSGARALVQMHGEELHEFLATWHAAQAKGLRLPATEDPNCQTMEALLFHVLRAARGYMTWMCEVLGLPDPDIRDVPAEASVAVECDRYVEHLVDRWRSPLVSLTEEAAYLPEYKSRWETLYCIDAMLEHAVMHPIRHRAQLERRMAHE